MFSWTFSEQSSRRLLWIILPHGHSCTPTIQDKYDYDLVIHSHLESICSEMFANLTAHSIVTSRDTATIRKVTITSVRSWLQKIDNGLH